MINIPNMIMIGSAGRNVGKTMFACRLISKYSSFYDVVAVKVTTIRDENSVCPRGGKGCGVCTSLQGNYSITEEKEGGETKDTNRMKKAGAKRVLWLRAKIKHLEEGISELIKMVPHNSCIICESNSARLVVEPGAFVVIREKGKNFIKNSCKEVINFADRIIAFENNEWNFPPERCSFENRQWIVPFEASAVILAGGQSSRMGTDKSMLKINGQTMMEKIIGQLKPFFDEILISANNREKYTFTGLPVVPDKEKAEGPLIGIFSSLMEAQNEKVFITACDIPILPTQFIKNMFYKSATADVVMARCNGRIEPLPALFFRRLIPIIQNIIESGKRRITAVLDGNKVCAEFVDMEFMDWYRNINTPDDYERMIQNDKL